MGTTTTRGDDFSKEDQVCRGALAAAYRVGFFPSWIRHWMELSWFDRDLIWDVQEEVYTAPNNLAHSQELFAELRQLLRTILEHSPADAVELQCIPKLDTAEAFLVSQWTATGSMTQRQAELARIEASELGHSTQPLPPVEFFDGVEWQDFFGVSLEKLASRLLPQFGPFYSLGRHLGKVIFAPLNIQRALVGNSDPRVASRAIVATTIDLMIQAAMAVPNKEWWPEESLEWEKVFSKAEKCENDEIRFDFVNLIRLILERKFAESIISAPLLKTRTIIRGEFGLKVIVDERNGSYVVHVYRWTELGQLGPITLTDMAARAFIELVRAQGPMPRQELKARVGTTTMNRMSQIKGEINFNCRSLGIAVKMIRKVGYRLVNIAIAEPVDDAAESTSPK